MGGRKDRLRPQGVQTQSLPDSPPQNGNGAAFRQNAQAQARFLRPPARAKVLHGGGKGKVRIAALSGFARGLSRRDGFPEFYAAPEKPYTP